MFITFSVAGTITVGSALPAISSDLTILGAGAVTVNGGGDLQVFNVGSVTVTLSGLTMTNGSTGGPGGGIAQRRDPDRHRLDRQRQLCRGPRRRYPQQRDPDRHRPSAATRPATPVVASTITAR